MGAMISRRKALRGLGVATASALFRSDVAAQDSPFRFALQPVDLIVSALSPQTVRLSVVPHRATAPIDGDGALAGFSQHPVQRVRTPGRVTAGELTLDIKAPLSVAVTSHEIGVQRSSSWTNRDRFTFRPAGTRTRPCSASARAARSSIGAALVDAMRNGQGGYQLRTHGGRVPIQWLVGTDGWGLFIHQPLGAFDLTGADRASFTAPDAAARSTCFVVGVEGSRASSCANTRASPACPRCRALWTFGYQQSHRTLAGPDEIMSASRRRSARRSCRATR